MRADIIGPIDSVRRAAGYLTFDETIALGRDGNRILDPFSILISKGVCLGAGNTLYPGCTIRAVGSAEVTIGGGNLFHSGTFIEASEGPVEIGSSNQFGEGGFTAKANQPVSTIVIGNNGRYLNNPSVFGTSELQDGSQILGNITVISCNLCAGGSYLEPDPDKRAGLLKGFGMAKGLKVLRGQVIQGEGIFDQSLSVAQSMFHRG
jgi:hypothetical protein